MTGKTCRTCGVTRPLERFSTWNSTSGPKLRGTCKDCKNDSMRLKRDSTYLKNWYRDNRDLSLAKSADYRKKNQEKLRSKSSTYYHSNKKEVKLRRLVSKYGISREQAEALETASCAICGASGEEHKKGLHVDHNHTSGKFRGFLCHCCNTALGLLKEDTTLLERMKEYINEHQ